MAYNTRIDDVAATSNLGFSSVHGTHGENFIGGREEEYFPPPTLPTSPLSPVFLIYRPWFHHHIDINHATILHCMFPQHLPLPLHGDAGPLSALPAY